MSVFIVSTLGIVPIFTLDVNRTDWIVANPTRVVQISTDLTNDVCVTRRGHDALIVTPTFKPTEHVVLLLGCLTDHDTVSPVPQTGVFPLHHRHHKANLQVRP